MRVALLTVSMLSAVVFCAGQKAPQTQTSDPAQSTQPPATSSSKQDKPGDQPSAQTNSQGPGGPVQQGPKKNEDAKKNDRMFYVMPNYLTVDGRSQVKPVSWKEKFSMAVKGSFDPYEFTVVGIVAGIRQAENSSPAFGQGFEGYAKRYGAAFADQVDGNIMVGGVYPTILKIDPRYFRLGTGSSRTALGMPSIVFSLLEETPVLTCSTFPSLPATQRRLLFPPSIIPPPIAVFHRVFQVGERKWVSTPLEMS